ncbi:hypothetical protein JL721_6370 [Aureococcus anophagefferens]|nr:hypothetical protein JL721_6370 [Aureococcus anophagefferens]
MDLRARVALAATIILFLIFTSDDVLVPLFGERFPPFHRNDVTFLVVSRARAEAAAGVETSELDRRHAALIKEKIHAVTFGQFTKYMTRDNVTNHHVRCDDDIVTARGFKWFHMQGGICPYGEGKYCGQNPAVDRVFRDWLRKHEVRIIMLERHGLAKCVSGLLKTNQTLPKHCETAACVARVGEVTVDVSVRNLLAKMKKEAKEWDAMRAWASAAGAAFLDVQFDDLARDPVRVVSDMYAFFGAQPHETNPHLLVKSIQRPLDEIIANYAEVEAALVGTPWEVPERRRVF